MQRWCRLWLMVVLCSCGPLPTEENSQAPTGVLNAYSVEPRYYWFGTAPFCDTSPKDCSDLAMEYVRSDANGDGERCWTGSKVLCRDRLLSWQRPEQPDDSFALITYNVFMRPALVAKDGQAERAEFIPSALATLAEGSVDVIVHEELFQDELKSRMADQYRQFGFSYYTAQTLSSPTLPANGGIAVFSRWPIQREYYHLFPNEHCSGSDCLAAKGVIYLAVKKPLREKIQTLHIFATHLQAWNTPEGRKIRHQQLLEIKNLQQRLAIPVDEPVFFVGDLNVDAHHTKDEYQQMMELLGAVPQEIPATMFSSDPNQSQLVGRDGAAEKQGCSATYGQTHTCACCPQELLDYVLIDKEHLQARLPAEVRIYRPRAPEAFSLCAATTVPTLYNASARSQWCKEVWETTDLSDHLAVYARFFF